MIRRELEKKIAQTAKTMPIIALLGPRQSGKTTLAKKVFPHHTYVNLEDLGTREMALNDPKGFLTSLSKKSGIIIDEVQYVPELFSYIQVISDELDMVGHFILTGSQSFRMSEKISQSLAGRIIEFILLPLSMNELSQAHLLPESLEEYVFKGGYPRLYNRPVEINAYYRNYTDTYIKKDIRELINIKNVQAFRKFLKSCAARSGQLLNLSSISNDLGISHSTVNEWIAVLEASYIVFLVDPYSTKIPKRLVKSPKLFFYDSGLVCSLLGITNSEELQYSYLRGALIETALVSDLYKQLCNLHQDPGKLLFWRTYSGNEIDVIIEKIPEPAAIEIKGGTTLTPNYFKEFTLWNSLTGTTNKSNYIIYGGSDTQKWPLAKVISWHCAGTLVATILNRSKSDT